MKIVIITLIGLLVQLTQVASGADKKGFESGGKTFTNPFLAPTSPGGRSASPDSDEDDEFDDGEDYGDNSPAMPPGKSPGKSTTAGTPSPSKEISMGGTSAGGVIQHGQATTVFVNDETAEGSNEIVTEFNFPDADILDIAKTLGKLTGKNFILDKDVKGRITIISNSAITVGDAWKAFLTALDMNGFAIIPSGKYIRIARQRDARDKQLKTYTGDYSPDTDALITRLFPLKYLSAEEVARNFRSFMPANSRIIPYEQTNTVIVTDTGSNIAKLSKLLDILDVEGYDAGIEVIPVKYASAVELSKLIDTLVPGTGGVGGGGGAGGPRFGGGKFAARRTKEGGIINTILSDERTNTLIVHANTKGADQIRALVAKLDQKLPSIAGGGKVHVMYLQFAEAEQIANTLNTLSSGGGRTAGPGGGTGVNPVQGSLFEGSIKVAPDKATNSLVITASPADYATVQRVVNRLDIPRDQVFAEVVIMEITLARDFNFSTNLISPKNAIGFTPNTDLFDFFQNPIGQKGAVLGFADKNTVSLNIGGTKIDFPNVMALIKTLQTRSNANILATPQILALDNTEATFETAERIPVLTSTAVSGAVAQSTTKENISLSISIKPQINKVANFVKLDITAKLEDISGRELPGQVQNLALATIQRNVKTSIVVADKDTAVLGGLIRDTSSEQISKIPILGDIPLLGWLFRAKKQQSSKTNMLVFITPHIVRQYDSIRAVLDKKLKERDEFIESSTGGDDPLRKYRDNMIRSLPDMSEIMAQKPERSVTLDEDQPAAVAVEEPKRPAPAVVQKAPESQPQPVVPPPAPAPVPEMIPPAPAPAAPPPALAPAPAPVPAPAPAPQEGGLPPS